MKLHYADGKTVVAVPIYELVGFAQDQVRRIQRDRENLGVAIETIKLRQPMNASDIDKVREFERVDWLRMGEQTALRNVCEWAKQQARKPEITVSQEDFKNQIDGVINADT